MKPITDIAALFWTIPRVDFRLRVQPSQLLSNPAMMKAERRAMLQTWAAEARGISSFPFSVVLASGHILTIDYPEFRQLPNGHLVIPEQIAAALNKLDANEPQPARNPEEASVEAQPKPRAGVVELLGRALSVMRVSALLR